MIAALLNWLANPNRIYRPAITYHSAHIPRTMLVAEQRWSVEQLFSPHDSFYYKNNHRISVSKKGMTINYTIPDFRSYLGDPHGGKISEVLLFRRSWVPFFPPRQFFLDFGRCYDFTEVDTGDGVVKVSTPSTELTLNGKRLRWHHQKDPSFAVPNPSYVAAPKVLERLYTAVDGNQDYLYEIVHILTQSPLNDMFKTIQVYITARWKVLVALSSSDNARNNYRGYHINVTKSGACTVRAMMAGFFSGCCGTTESLMAARQPNKEIGWFRCTTEFCLTTKTATFANTFILYPENWKSS